MRPESQPTVTRFDNIAHYYDTARPTPPPVIVDLLTTMAGVTKPRLVVDLGSGTGLSTVIWADRAFQAIGVEPNKGMRTQAERRAQATDGGDIITFCPGLAAETGLPAESADVVTCSQSLHWMEPQSTFAEVDRILRPGGVFAAIDCDWPPTISPEIDPAYSEFMDRSSRIEQELGITEQVKRWPKAEHLRRMRECGRFRFCKEVLVHGIEAGDAERLVALARSFGSVAMILKRGVSEEDLGVPALATLASRVMGTHEMPWVFSYRVRVGLK